MADGRLEYCEEDREGVVRHKDDRPLTGALSTCTRWTSEEDEWIRTHYLDKNVDLQGALPGRTRKAITSRASHLRVKRPIGLRKGSKCRPRRVYDETLICQQYQEMRSLRRVAEAQGMGESTISGILKKHGVRLRFRGFDQHAEGIIKDYQSGTFSMRALEVKYGYSGDQIRENLKQLGLYKKEGCYRFTHSESPYQCWVNKHGKDEADRRFAVMKANQSKSSSGCNNPMYGKPSPQGAGNGWKGWYKELYFRSLRELMFMVELDQQGVEWKTGETVSIPYCFMDRERTYRPDFIVGQTLYEIKPLRLHDTPNVQAKHMAALCWCKEHDMTYRLTDVIIDTDAIHTSYLAGHIRFDRDYETRFLTYLDTHRPAGRSPALPIVTGA